MKSFSEIIEDQTKTAVKIPQSDYLESGKYRIFDQGKDYSVGFSNDENGVVYDFPYIIFGDHTRVVKFVNEPCFIGADGVKLLKVTNNNFDSKYVYYNILAKPIESQGYARHFKFLKEIHFSEKSLPEQQKIAAELDTIQSAIDNKKQQLSLLDEAVKSRFIEMFGDNPTENGKWNIEKIEDVCTVTSSKRIYAEEQSTTGVPFLRISDLVSRINGNPINDLFIPNSKFKEFQTKGLIPSVNDILITSRGTLGLCYIIKPEDEFYFQDGMITWLAFKNHNKVLSVFIDWLFKSVLKTKIDNETNGATVKYVSISDLKKLQIPVPPLELQNNFAAFVQQIDKSKFVVKQQIADLQELLDYKMNKYFGD